jgi:hypothetical protein
VKYNFKYSFNSTLARISSDSSTKIIFSLSIKIESPRTREQRNENICESVCVNELVPNVESFERQFTMRREMKVA